MFEHGFPKHWSTLKKFVWLIGSGVIGGASAVWKTVTGALIHITDALASPMQKCEVSLEPIQDLHGQDAPYPAGGGANVIPENGTGWFSPYGAISSTFENGVWTITNVHSTGRSGRISVGTLTAGTWYGSFGAKSSTFGLELFNAGTGTKIGNFRSDGGSTSFTLETDAECYINSTGFDVGTNTITNLMLSKTDVSYSPHANICPITGWTGCEMNQRETNLLTTTPIRRISKARVNSTTGEIVQNNYGDLVVYAIPKTTIYLYKDNTSEYYHGLANNPNLSMGDFCDEPWSVRWSKENSKDNQYAYFYGYVGVDGLPNYSITVDSLGEVLPLSQNGTTASVTFPETVFGGKYEFVSGKEMPTKAGIRVGELSWEKIASGTGFNAFRTEIADKAVGVYNVISDSFKTTTAAGYSALSNNEICGRGATPGYVYIRADNYSSGTAEEFKTAFSDSQIVYELAEPTEISLTPQPISTLKGENNVWSNSNGDITLIYKAQAS